MCIFLHIYCQQHLKRQCGDYKEWKTSITLLMNIERQFKANGLDLTLCTLRLTYFSNSMSIYISLDRSTQLLLSTSSI